MILILLLLLFFFKTVAKSSATRIKRHRATDVAGDKRQNVLIVKPQNKQLASLFRSGNYQRAQVAAPYWKSNQWLNQTRSSGYIQDHQKNASYTSFKQNAKIAPSLNSEKLTAREKPTQEGIVMDVIVQHDF